MMKMPISNINNTIFNNNRILLTFLERAKKIRIGCIVFICLLAFNATYATINDGLIAYYPFNGNANDASVNNYHGFVVGATLTTDRNGNSSSAYYFDGENDYIRIPNLSVPSEQVSISFWAKPESFGNILSKHNDPTDIEILIRPNMLTNNYSVEWTIGNIFKSGAGGLIDDLDTFDHVVVIYDGTLVKMYVNNEFQFQYFASGTIFQNDYVFTIGAQGNNPNIENYGGKVDDIRIYNRVLTEEEIDILFNIDNCDDPINTNHLLMSGNVAKITWDAVDTADRYRIRYRTSGGTWIERYTGGTETFRFLNELTPNTSYEYQVKALCASINSTWSASRSFTTPADYCNIPTGIGTSSINNNQAIVSWTPSIDDIKYKIKYKQIGSSWVEVIINNTAYTMTNLLPASDYKFKVKTKCALGWTNWSTKYLFSTPNMMPRKIDASLKASINVFPNPTYGILNVRLKNSFSQLIIRDVNGKVVKSLEANSSKRVIDVSNYAKGIYYLIGITEDGKVEHVKFVKAD